MNKKPVFFYIKPNNSSFIRNDEKILSKNFEVNSILLNQSNGNVKYGLKLLKLSLLLFYKSLRRPIVFVSWFGDYHSAIASFVGRITGVKTVIFIGGQEAVSYHDLKRGLSKSYSLCICKICFKKYRFNYCKSQISYLSRKLLLQCL